MCRMCGHPLDGHESWSDADTGDFITRVCREVGCTCGLDPDDRDPLEVAT